MMGDKKDGHECPDVSYEGQKPNEQCIPKTIIQVMLVAMTQMDIVSSEIAD